MSEVKEEQKDEGYTQREWDRVVGIGKVPDEYAKRIKTYEEKQRRYDKGQIMYDFEVKVKVTTLYEIMYEDVVIETDQREGAYERKLVKAERFAEWDKLRSFAYELKGKKILQVLEVNDMTNGLHREMTSQGKD